MASCLASSHLPDLSWCCGEGGVSHLQVLSSGPSTTALPAGRCARVFVMWGGGWAELGHSRCVGCLTMERAQDCWR